MSTENGGSKEDDFDIRLWMIDLKKCDVRQKKEISNEITDDEILKSLDVSAIKLSVRDNWHFIDGISSIKASVPASDVTANVNPEENTGSAAENVQVGVLTTNKTNYTVDEVASFLAGNPIPSHIQSTIDMNRQAVQGSSQGFVTGPSLNPGSHPGQSLNSGQSLNHGS